MAEENFFERVYAIARQIPYGKVTSYGAIAKYLGTKMSARMVGWAMNAAHSDPTIPAQRVVNRNGMLSGKAHFGEPDRMKKLLEKDDDDSMPDQKDKLLKDRNLNWITQLPAIMQQQPTFIAVGAGHLVGDYGLIKQLRLKGYKVTAVKI